MPPRIQRFRLRLMRFNPHAVYVPGKQQLTADVLPRAPVGKTGKEDQTCWGSGKLHKQHAGNTSSNSKPSAGNTGSTEGRWGVLADSKVLRSRLAGLYASSASNATLLRASEPFSSRRWPLAIWRPYCHPKNHEVRDTRLYPHWTPWNNQKQSKGS